MILDYSSNELSMDPVNIFKRSSDLYYNLTEKSAESEGSISSDSENFSFRTRFSDYFENNVFDIDEDLIKYSDNIYYSNGVYDKLYYDSSLSFQKLYKPNLIDSKFKFHNFSFIEPDSIFIFKDKISFSGSIWKNIYDF